MSFVCLPSLPRISLATFTPILRHSAKCVNIIFVTASAQCTKTQSTSVERSEKKPCFSKAGSALRSEFKQTSEQCKAGERSFCPKLWGALAHVCSQNQDQHYQQSGLSLGSLPLSSNAFSLVRSQQNEPTFNYLEVGNRRTQTPGSLL
ncbi:hypothetical protein H920_15436 [Fukomys damarensis]|uniref:Uncharacterized protein n=1 Tax=Fukomys damarensis TaxID=885580 RepID=A0A091DKG0_FUKDA|nr:hypothetical protein H920_15436 [Fukomys damarensis]